MKKIKYDFRKISAIGMIVRLYPVALNLIVSILISKMVDQALAGSVNHVVELGLITLSAVILFRFFNTVMQVKYQAYISRFKHRYKMELYQKYLSNPLSVLYQTDHGKMIENLNDDFDAFIGQYTDHYPAMLASSIGAVIYFLFIFRQSWLIAVTLLTISLLQVLPPLIIKKFLQINYDNCRAIEAKITNFTFSGYQGFLTIKSYHLQEWWMEKLQKLHKEYLQIGSKSELTSTFDDVITNTIDHILKYGTYAIIGLFALFQYIALDVGIQAITLAPYFYEAMKDIFTPLENLAVAQTAGRRIAAILPETNLPDSLIHDGDLHFENISFQYEGKSIVNGLNLTVYAHQITLIKGHNGIGKSTLLMLLSGLLRCDSGRITVGNTELATLDGCNFPSGIYYLMQQDPTYNFSAYDLFHMAVPEHMDQALAITEKFHLEAQTIRHTLIKELSGGQRKKVFLSLAFAANPLVLFLDEPTNSLDSDAIQTLCKLLEQYDGTTVIVSHESFFDEMADRCLVMENGGKIVETEK